MVCWNCRTWSRGWLSFLLQYNEYASNITRLPIISQNKGSTLFVSETRVTSPGPRPGRWYMVTVCHTGSMALTWPYRNYPKYNYIWGWLGCTSRRKVDSQPPSGLHSGVSAWIFFHKFFRDCLYLNGNEGLKSRFSFYQMDRFPGLSSSIYLLRRVAGLGCQKPFQTHATEAFYGHWQFVPTITPSYDNI